MRSLFRPWLMAAGLGQPFFASKSKLQHLNATECNWTCFKNWVKDDETRILRINFVYKDVGRSSRGFCFLQTLAPRLGIRLRVFDGGGAREVASWATQWCHAAMRLCPAAVPSFSVASVASVASRHGGDEVLDLRHGRRTSAPKTGSNPEKQRYTMVYQGWH